MKIVLSVVKKIFRMSHALLITLKISKPKVIVLMDGGISSQVYQYLLGLQFVEKGYAVEYDLDFFRTSGKDMFGVYARNFDLEKAFEGINIIESKPKETFLYKRLYLNKGNYFSEKVDYDFLSKKPPLYLGGYYNSPIDLWIRMFSQYISFNENAVKAIDGVFDILDHIENQSFSVSVHVRRGDLSKDTVAYGKPASVDYFLKAIEYFRTKRSDCFFYFFSDEVDWVLNHIIPEMKTENYMIVDQFGSDKGYADLFLISKCTHQIASKGSFGKFGCLLNENKEKILIVPNDETEFVWKDRVPNVIFL